MRVSICALVVFLTYFLPTVSKLVPAGVLFGASVPSSGSGSSGRNGAAVGAGEVAVPFSSGGELESGVSKAKFKEVKAISGRGTSVSDQGLEQREDEVYLAGTFICLESGERFAIRQVPGDGGCLFHALTVAMIYEKTRKHVAFDEKSRHMSDKLRKLSVLLLKRKDVSLYIENVELRAAPRYSVATNTGPPSYGLLHDA